MYSARPGGQRYRPVLDRLPVAVSGTVTLVAGGALALGLGALGELHSGWFALVAYAALCGLLGAFSRPPAAPVIGLAAWLCCNAFAEHRHAELGWAGPWPEGGHVALFSATALLVSLPAAMPRRTVRAASVVFGHHRSRF